MPKPRDVKDEPPDCREHCRRQGRARKPGALEIARCCVRVAPCRWEQFALPYVPSVASRPDDLDRSTDPCASVRMRPGGPFAGRPGPMASIQVLERSTAAEVAGFVFFAFAPRTPPRGRGGSASPRAWSEAQMTLSPYLRCADEAISEEGFRPLRRTSEKRAGWPPSLRRSRTLSSRGETFPSKQAIP
ncbi:hypothetical protein BC628DRAFT_1340987 [Trametes gibbosa]|nr:hypothetical protein BC628DRAFT_1340987 [Trametes gibbosa]